MHRVQPYNRVVPLLQRRDLIDREFRWLIPLGVKYLQELWEDESTDSCIIDAVLDYALEVSESQSSTGSGPNVHSTDSSYVDASANADIDVDDSLNNFSTCQASSTTTKNNVKEECRSVLPSHDNRKNEVPTHNSNSHFYSSPYDLLMTLDVARRSVTLPSILLLLVSFRII